MMSIVCVRWRQMSGAVLIKTRFLLNVYAHSMKEYNMNNKLNVFVWSRCAGACVEMTNYLINGMSDWLSR